MKHGAHPPDCHSVTCIACPGDPSTIIFFFLWLSTDQKPMHRPPCTTNLTVAKIPICIGCRALSTIFVFFNTTHRAVPTPPPSSVSHEMQSLTYTTGLVTRSPAGTCRSPFPACPPLWLVADSNCML